MIPIPPPATISYNGLMSTGLQTFAGQKNFDAGAIFNATPVTPMLDSSSYTGIIINFSQNDPLGTVSALNIQCVNNLLTVDNANVFIAASVNLRVDQNNHSLTSHESALRCYAAQSYAIGSLGTISGACGYFSTAGNIGAGTLTQAAGFVCDIGVNSGGGVLSTFIGFEAKPTDSTVASLVCAFRGRNVLASNVYNIYMVGSAQNYLAGNLGVGVLLPLSKLHLGAGSAIANSAPLQFNSGTLETTPRAGLVEYNGRFVVTENTTNRFLVQAVNDTKVTAGAPLSNDGYVQMVINGTTYKFMTTA